LYLITYRCEDSNGGSWGYDFASDPMEWLIESQKYEDEVYYLINTQKVTPYQEQKWNGNLKGQ
jgi:hypothetical protein